MGLLAHIVLQGQIRMLVARHVLPALMSERASSLLLVRRVRCVALASSLRWTLPLVSTVVLVSTVAAVHVTLVAQALNHQGIKGRVSRVSCLVQVPTVQMALSV
jgi:uncharacterized membrane protein